MRGSPDTAGLRIASFALVALVLGFASPLTAQDTEETLAIELNKVETTEQGCRTLFVFDNRTGHELHRFRVDLILFDQEGVYQKQLLLDMAPLYADKKTVASFLLGEEACGKIGSILINDIPHCENGVGNVVECVDRLEVRSKSDIPLEK